MKLTARAFNQLCHKSWLLFSSLIMRDDLCMLLSDCAVGGIVKTLADCGHIERVSCGWNSTCVIIEGTCYINDLTTSLWHRVLIPLTKTSDSAADDCIQQCGSVETSINRHCDDLPASSSSGKHHLGRFVFVDTNDVSTFAVTSDRDLLSICHQPDSYQIMRVLSGLKVSSVSCGRRHTLVLSAIGVVFSCGLGNQGQLGHGSLQSEDSLRVIEALEGVRMTSICAGGWHSMALSDCGDIYVWGWNEAGQLGLKCQSRSVLTSSRLHSADEVTPHICSLLSLPLC